MEPGTPGYKILFSGGIMILIMLSLFGNILVCFAVYHSRNLRARVNYLIVSLAFADILIASVSMPLWMAFEMTHYRNMSHEAGLRLMRYWTFIDILGGIASITNLVAISYERLWSVFSPLKHRRYLTNYTLAGIIIGVWAYAIFVALTAVFLLHDWDYNILYTAIVGFFFPLFLIFTAYAIIFIIVNRSPRTVVSSQDNFKINLTICIIVGLFVLCWAPHFIFSVLHMHCTSCAEHFLENLWYRSLTTWLHYANSCVNPLVYGIANAQYKEAFKAVFKKMCLCCLFKKEITTTTPALPVYSPQARHNKSINIDKLRVELDPDDKEPEGATGYNRRVVETNDMYLPGDYRALPVFPSPRTRRWNSDTSTTTETFLSTSVMESPSIDDDSTALKKALLNPELLSRTSYL